MTFSRFLRVPHTLVLLYAMIVLAWVLTLVLPAAQFDTVLNELRILWHHIKFSTIRAPFDNHQVRSAVFF